MKLSVSYHQMVLLYRILYGTLLPIELCWYSLLATINDIDNSDLKPDNVGFNFEGRVKLFDFGLAKELDPLQKTTDGMYEMSGGTGSRRFMAPEVALGQPYNLSADIYSFSILFWELVALEKAFGKLSQDEHRENVIKKNDRPILKREWRPAIQYILQNCWKRNPRERTSAKELYMQLKEQVDSYYHNGFESYEEGRERKMCI